MSQVIQTSSACVVMFLLVQATVAGDDSGKAPDIQAAQLSVPLSDQLVEYPSVRPEWIDAPTNLKDLPHTWVVVSGPCDTRSASEEELRLMLHASIETYLRGLPDADGRFDFFPITDEWIEDNVITLRYSGDLTQAGLPMYEDAVQVKIDSKNRAEFLAALQNVEVRDRLAALGMLVFTGLVGLMCTSAFFGMVSRRVERRDAVAVSPGEAS